MQQVVEPSVEDILESIKKVIARDTPRPPMPAARPLAERTISAQAPIEDNADDVLDLATADELGATESPLIASAASASMRDSLAALAMLAQPSARPRIVRSDETSVEGLVRELLKPALAEWLDKNLPAMVEKMVAAEIARIVGKKG